MTEANAIPELRLAVRWLPDTAAGLLLNPLPIRLEIAVTPFIAEVQIEATYHFAPFQNQPDFRLVVLRHKPYLIVEIDTLGRLGGDDTQQQ